MLIFERNSMFIHNSTFDKRKFPERISIKAA
jgi:hypothetical protein